MTINKERVQLLVDALRSGEFTQGTGSLRSHDRLRHCCLGVATEVALRNGLKIHDDTGETWSYPWNMSHQVMCLPVAEWYGFDHTSPTLLGYPDDQHPRQAVVWNDELGANFEAIAAGFERTYLADETPAT